MNEFVKTPPMGWNSWDCYGAAVNEDTVRANAEFMAKHLRQYGWEYIVVDIQWSNPTAKNHEYQQFTELCMDEYSRLIPAVERFPSSEGGKGFAPLAEYVHSLGLKFGIHIMRGIPRQAVHRNTAIKGTSRTAVRSPRLPAYASGIPTCTAWTPRRRAPGILRQPVRALQGMGRGFHQGGRYLP